MFHFATGIKSIRNFDPTLELEKVRHRTPVGRHHFDSAPATQYPTKQAYLYNETVAAATKLRGSFE